MHSDQDAQNFEQVMAMKPAPDFVMPEVDVSTEVRNARKSDGQRYYDTFRPKAFHGFDAAHPLLASNVAAINSILSWEYESKGLLITGPTGKGKSRSCWELLRRLYAQEGLECRWYHSMDWLTELNECMKYGRDDAKGWVSDVAWRRVVFLDDWGQEANAKSREDWAQSWFFRFLDYRLERRLPLIITTNLTAKDIAQKNSDVRGDPLLRRLLEVCTVVKFT